MLHLAQHRAALGVHAAVEDRVGPLRLDGSQDGGEISRLVVRVLLVDDLHAAGQRRLLEHFGNALAIGRAVVDDRDLLELQIVGGVEREPSTQCVVVRDDAIDVLEPLLRQLRVRGRAGDHRKAAIVVDLRRRDRGAGVQVTDHAVDLGVAQLGGHGRALLRVRRVVFGHQLELDLLAADHDALGVEILDRHAGADRVVLAIVRLPARHGRNVADLDNCFLCRRGDGAHRDHRAHDHIELDLHAKTSGRLLEEP